MTDIGSGMGLPMQAPIEQAFADYEGIEAQFGPPPIQAMVSSRDALLADGPASARQTQKANLDAGVVAEHPLLNAPDSVTAAQAVAGTNSFDMPTASRAAVIDMYAQRVPEGHAGSQIDFAKMQALDTAGLLVGERKQQWDRFLAGDLDEDAASKLLDTVQALGDGTSSRAKPDFSDVSGIDFTDTGVIIRTKPAEISSKEIAAFKGSTNTKITLPSVVTPDVQMVLDPDGSAVATGAVDVANATKLRHMSPAVTDGSAAVWAPSEAQRVIDLPGLMDDMGVQNASEGDMIDLLALGKAGGYWGHKPGNFVVFEAEAPPKGVPAKNLGMVRTLAPEKSLQKLDPGKLSPDGFDAPTGPLATSAWAVLPTAAQQSVRSAGFKPVNQGDSILVFGMTAEEATRYTTGEVVTQDGVWVNGEQQPDPEDRVYRAAIGGKAVEWNPRNYGTMDSDDSDMTVRRGPKLARRWLVEIEEGDAGSKAAQLELAGMNNVSVYAHSMPGDKSWLPIREHAYTDGQGLYLHRTRDPELTSEHGTIVYVRPERAEPLPPASAARGDSFEQRAPGQFVVNDAAVIEAGQVDQPKIEFWKLTREGQRPSGVTVDMSGGMPVVRPVWGDVPAGGGKLEGGKVVFQLDGDDVLPAVQAGRVLARIGVPRSKIEVRASGKTLTLG